MLRSVHRWPGLILAILILVSALSGAALSVFPALERLSSPQAGAEQSLADLLGRVGAAHPGLEQIRRAPSGQISAWWSDESGTPGRAVVDPASGTDVAPAATSPAELWLTDLHRALFLGRNGRLVMAFSAAGMLVLTLSGAAMVARRMGGWRHWFGRSRGPWPGRVHVDLARFAVGGLMLSSLTGLWMTASAFSLLPDDSAEPDPVLAQGLPPLPPERIALFATTPARDLVKLTFPDPQDPTDVYTLTTTGGTALIDPGSGAVLASVAPTAWERASAIVTMLHTGRGAAVLGLILGLMVLSVPVLVLTGTVQWLRTRRSGVRIPGNTAAGTAETILLVASEGGTTWGFARTLFDGLTRAGQSVHAAELSQFDPARYGHAKRFILLAATYGEGEAPTVARGVLARIAALPAPPAAPVAILGFGDRSFTTFCGYAAQLAEATRALGWAELIAPCQINRQSPQEFARWSRDLGAALGIELDLTHLPEVPPAVTLSLISRRDHGAEVGAPAAILRFALPPIGLWARLSGQGFARFQAGDLLGVLPAGSDLPRFYSLASGRRDGFVEICVRRQEGGLCSGQLNDLQPGDRIAAFVRPNPAFHPEPGRKPLILIGAGAGIAPLAGFVRANRRGRPLHLWFGARSKDSDFLYGDDLHRWQDRGQLATLETAFSRSARPEHVQDRMSRDRAALSALLAEGAQVMVCGGRDMAAGVRGVLNDILAERGEDLTRLKAEGRYAEDIF
uniref:PepSY domain-containing protein n=1 Tax=Paenirhodobacter enshiensis TaxID=1105367 RepID=UPI0035B316C5